MKKMNFKGNPPPVCFGSIGHEKETSQSHGRDET